MKPNFRDQNFGLNELAAIQDVRNDFNLQDIQDDTAANSNNNNNKDRGECIFLFNNFDYQCV